MDSRYSISLVLEAHLPFIKEFRREDDMSQLGEESYFFELITETLLPLLETLDRLENDHIPFRISFVISPIVCNMLADEYLQKKYLHYIDRQIEFGSRELERTKGREDLNALALLYYNQFVDRRIAYTERYDKKLLKAFDFYRRKGKVEILASCATHAFLPFLSHNAESLQAQIETPVSIYRRNFGHLPQGFWLPCLGWTPAIEQYMRSYNYIYTIIDSHGLLFGKPVPETGSFFPAKTPEGTFIFARDFNAVRQLEKITEEKLYRSNDRDVGYELDPETVKEFLDSDGERHKTGYKYRTRCEDENAFYNPKAASEKVTEHARFFLEKTVSRLEEASKYMKASPLCLCAYNADDFGRFWYEGTKFLETLFRLAAGYRSLQFVCPSEYIFKQDLASLPVTVPEFSSSGINGYAENWLNVSNDWIYRHLNRAMERMTELAERFPDDSGLKERALNQAARELLLAQASDWPALLYNQDSTEFARSQAENALRNFTTIYESLGSNYISTEWLTTLERRHNIFPNINYRVFRRKK